MTKLVSNRKLALIASVIFFGLIVITVGIYQLSIKNITVSIDGQKTEYETFSKVLGELIKEENIKVSKEDYINVSLDEKLKDDMEIIIERAVPVSIDFGKKTLEVNTARKTVKDVLDDHKISYDNDDIITPSLNEAVKSALKITVVSISEETEIKTEKIPYQTTTKENAEVEKGKIKLLQEGKEGTKEIEIKRVFKNGELESEEIVAEEIVQEPVNEIIEKGTKDFFISSRGNTAYKRSIVMSASAYDLSYESTGKKPGDENYGITASGTKARPGVVAVDPKVIPLGTKLYIQSLDGGKDYGFAVAEDTGGAIKGEKIDLFFESHKEALKFGRRKVKVYILD